MLVSPFGEQTEGNTFIALEDLFITDRDTTLYCITENANTPQVTWRFKNITGDPTVLSTTTNATTGVSTLRVTNDEAGYYWCEVSQNGGDNRIYITWMLPSNSGN